MHKAPTVKGGGQSRLQSLANAGTKVAAHKGDLGEAARSRHAGWCRQQPCVEPCYQGQVVVAGTRQSRAAWFLREALSPQKTRPVVTAKTWGLTHESPAGRSPARPALSGLTAARSCSDTESAGSAWGPDVGSRERAGEVQGTADSCSPETASGRMRLIAAVQRLPQCRPRLPAAVCNPPDR